MTVVDASVVAAALLDTGRLGQWAEGVLSAAALAAPHLMPAEAANVLRRASAVGNAPAVLSALAHQELLSLPVELFPYAPFAERVWELRSNVTAYDAWYVALAESLGTALATLDLRLARAPGPRCAFLTPEP